VWWALPNFPPRGVPISARRTAPHAPDRTAPDRTGPDQAEQSPELHPSPSTHMTASRVPTSPRPQSPVDHTGDTQPSGFERGELGRGERALTWALAAAAGLCLAACEKADDGASAGKSAPSTGSAEKNCCHGKNACKGQGGCAVPGKNDCAGKNECKGQGGCNMKCSK